MPSKLEVKTSVEVEQRMKFCFRKNNLAIEHRIQEKKERKKSVKEQFGSYYNKQ